jgi:HSP90 family molecular chaperone
MSEEIVKHEFGPGVLRELATKLYKNPISAFREGVSNALDAMIPYPENQRIEIRTNVPPHNDIVFEDWGTGIEDFNIFKTISPGQKIVANEVSSYDKMNEKIIGQKGMGKLSFLNLSDEHTVEFYSSHESVGMRVIMTMDGFTVKHMNSDMALLHHGLKVVIKRAKKVGIPDSRLRDYLRQVFAIRIARGAKILVNGEKLSEPLGFDPRQFNLFELDNGIKVYGHLKSVEKPRPTNIDIYVKRVYVDSKDFEHKVEGWLNCDNLDVETSRDHIL